MHAALLSGHVREFPSIDLFYMSGALFEGFDPSLTAVAYANVALH
jgi:hypothetical protein